MIRLRLRSTRTDTLFPYTTLVRSGLLRAFEGTSQILPEHGGRARAFSRDPAVPVGAHSTALQQEQIGRAHVCTPVTNEQLVCRLLLAKKQEATIHPQLARRQN